MGVTREDLIRTGKWLEVPDDEWEAQRKSVEDLTNRLMSNDEWANKIFNKVGILMTSHQGNRPFLKASVETHKKLGLWLTLVYDNFIDPAWPQIDYNRYLPPKDVIDKVDMFLMPHHQVWGGVLYPWFWSVKWGTDVMQQFEYIYCTNGDFVLEKPEGFPDLLKLLTDQDGDVMSYGPSSDRVESTCFIAKSSALKKIMQHMQDHLIPFENYEKYTQDIGNAEGRFARAIKDLGLKKVIVEPPYNEQMHLPGYGTWYNLVGYRHIHGELSYAYRHKGIPPEPQYMDERFASSNDMRASVEYHSTKNKEVLNGWWAKD